jgi:hypothetical protein
MSNYYIELSIPDTGRHISFYLEGETGDDVTPKYPFISYEDGRPYTYGVKVIVVENIE